MVSLDLQTLSVHARACWERKCAGKEQFSTRGGAEGFLRLMHSGKLRKYGISDIEWEHMEPYECEFAEPGNPHWHIGHCK